MKKKFGLALTAVAVMAIIGVCIGAAKFRQSPALFHFDPSEVTSIRLENGDSKLTQVTITEPSQMEDIVKLVNHFTYHSSEKIPPASGCGYSIHLKTASGGVGFEFWSDGVKLADPNGEPGASINYYGETGYFDTLVALADAATDPL